MSAPKELSKVGIPLDRLLYLEQAAQERDEAVAAVAGKDEALQKVLNRADEWCCYCDDWQGGQCVRDTDEPDCDRRVIGKIVVPAMSPSLGASILQQIEDMRDLLEGVDTATDGEALGLDLYAVRKFLKDHKCVSRKDAALAQMRGALEHFLIGAKHMSCMYKPDDPDPTWHCCNWSEVVEQIEKVLSSPAGKDLLERLRQAEELLAQVKPLLLDCLSCEGEICPNYKRCHTQEPYATVDAFLEGGEKA